MAATSFSMKIPVALSVRVPVYEATNSFVVDKGHALEDRQAQLQVSGEVGFEPDGANRPCRRL
jgi:hypothetical protein